jgi:hypothetical protein
MDKKECECLFCNAKCPECGSDNVTVRYEPIFEFENDSHNRIDIYMVGARVSLSCLSCYEDFETIGDEVDPAMQPLVEATRKALDIPTCVHYKSAEHRDDNGRFEQEAVYLGRT